MNIRILSDGKPGHVNQSSGLAQALKTRMGGRIDIINLNGLGLLQKIRRATQTTDAAPDLIIAAGHSTHLPLLAAGFHFGVPTILCMKPSLPCRLFGCCVIPRHDLSETQDYSDTNILPTLGALHGIHPTPGTPKTITLILLGGPSHDFDWDLRDILSQLRDIRKHTSGDIVLTSSRRTPAGTVEAIRETIPGIRVVPVEETRPGWVQEHLAKATNVWVSQDSVSMVYEALGSGAPVGILSVPPRSDRKSSRIARGLELLHKVGLVTPRAEWQQNAYCLPQPSAPLQEADRIAKQILTRFFNTTTHS